MTGNPEERTPLEEAARDAVRSLAPARPDADFRARLGQAFVSGEIAREVPRVVPIRPRTWPVWALAAAAALLVVFLFSRDQSDATAFIVTSVDATGSIESVDAEPIPMSELRAGSTTLPAGADVLVGSGAVELLLPGLVAIRANPGSLRLPTTVDGPLEFTVAKGEVLFVTGPDFPGRRILVHTPEGRVEVVGTAFAVYRDDAVTCVCVLEGEALVGVDEADLQPIPPGKRKVMHADGKPSEILDIVPAHRAGIVEFVDRAREQLTN